MLNLIYSGLIFLIANIYLIEINSPNLIWVLLASIFFLFININPSFGKRKLQSTRLIICRSGCDLLDIFIISTFTLFIYYLVILINGYFTKDIITLIINIVIGILIEICLFSNGIIRVYLTSVQLRLKWRIIGIVVSFIPLINIIVLFKIIRIVRKEIKVENEKILLNKKRESEKICSTKYPILLVHGIYFRDYRYYNYWGRIPKELERNGAKVYYGNHPSATSVEHSAKQINNRIKSIVEETGCEKVNIIAHSKGGLDCKYAISVLDTEQYVASLTTVNTPHRGCEFADYILNKVPDKLLNFIADKYNRTLAKLGDKNPDFITATQNLTSEACEEMNKKIKDISNIYCQSVGSKLNKANNGRFPLNFTYKFVKSFDGPNDGLVGAKSFRWGENYTFINALGNRGISHGDMIDLNRENFDEFDVREFYVQLVSDLKSRGF